jgi:hypothetical protein
MAPPRSGAPPTDTFDPMDETGAKRQRPDRANEAQTQVRLRPRARLHRACLPGGATFLAAMALWLGLGLASEFAKGDVTAAKACSGAAAPLLNTSASAVNHLPPHPRWPNICTNTHTPPPGDQAIHLSSLDLHHPTTYHARTALIAPTTMATPEAPEVPMIRGTNMYLPTPRACASAASHLKLDITADLSLTPPLAFQVKAQSR